MSLQVWLPLNGNLNNQGLSDVTITNNGATVNNTGKIGKCYYFNATSQYINLSNYMTTLKTFSNYSMSAWVYIETKAGDHSASILSSGNWNQATGQLVFGFYSWSTDHYTKLLVPNTSGWSNGISYNFMQNTWYHITITYNGSKTLAYVNGVKIGEYNGGGIATTSETNNLYVGCATYYGSFNLRGKLNDVRIYDHCLSPKEVEEISKGLVLHYKLNGDCFGNPNILLNTSFSSLYNQTTGWDTAKNGTVLANSWGGYNSGVGNASTVYHAHLKQFNREYVYEYIRTADESWLGISQGGLQSKLIAGKTYTFSWEQYCVNGANHVGTGLYYFKTGATSANFHLGIQQGSANKKMGEWQKFTYTFIAPSDADYTKSMNWYIYGDYGGQGTMYVRRPKLEEGSAATEWMPALSENPLNNYIIYDTSGYNNNGEIHDTTIKVDNESVRYNYSTKNDQASNSTSYPYKGNLILNDIEKMTISFWAKPIRNGHQDSGIFSTSGNGAATDYQATAINHYDSKLAFTNTSGTVVNLNVNNQFTINQWHHYVFIYDGTKVYFYKDNVLITSANQTGKLKPITHIFPFFSCAGGAYRTTSGNISDVRFYVTALTAAQIKELYDTSATVDSFGNIYTREAIE